MRADKIPDIIKQLRGANSPYRCVMISGEWGIGKSYQVNAEMPKYKPVGYCSLFGLNTMDDILGQLLFRLSFNRDKLHISLKQATDSVNLGKLEPIKRVLGNVFSPQMALDFILKQYEQKRKITLLVFDDIERISQNIDFDLFLGTVESLMQAHKSVRVLFVANLSQFSETQYAIWEKYSEKVVDQVFPIEDLAENIAILETPEHNVSALDFMKQHGSKNLRTLQKAQCFFADVSQKVGDIDSDLLKDPDTEQLLFLACYSVVFENTEKIYEHEGQRLREEAANSDVGESTYQRIVREQIYANIESIICNKYLNNIANTDAKTLLVQELINYYLHGNDHIPSIVESLVGSHKIEKPTFYCSDDEVALFITQQRDRLERQDYTNLYQFLKIVDDIFIWSSVLGFDTSDVVLIAKKKIPELYMESSKEDRGQPWSLNHYNEYLSSDKLKEILHSLNTESEKAYYQHIIKELSEQIELTNYSEVFDILYAIQGLIHPPTSRRAITDEGLFSALCNDSLLPLGSCSERQYYCTEIAYVIAMTINQDEWVKYLQDAKKRFSTDKMFLDRMKQIEISYEKSKSN